MVATDFKIKGIKGRDKTFRNLDEIAKNTRPNQYKFKQS
jgi:hypothetical protein